LSAYTPETILKAIESVIRDYQRRKETGRITPVIDITQGAIAKAKIRKETAIQR